ncbi:MAG: HigA family addiction module antidote protein [Candidatus Brocadiae bacterium]|nr:HigA family addiction module antidote protein [Candidatus Brocadiia bacterium]
MSARLPKDPTHPGEMLLEEFLKPMGLTQSAFAKHTGVSFKRINEIVNGRRSTTPETAWLFSQALGTTPQFWMNLQTTYDLVHGRAGRKVERITAHASQRTASQGSI